jgi:hypothetical protein
VMLPAPVPPDGPQRPPTASGGLGEPGGCGEGHESLGAPSERDEGREAVSPLPMGSDEESPFTSTAKTP